MTNYYVSPTGNDANNGSSSSPWLTPQNAVGKLAPGDTLWFYDGTYDQSNNGYGYFYTKDAGTSSQPITYQSINPLGAKLTSNGSGNPSTIWYNQADYINVVGFELTGTVKDAIEINANHCYIKNCYVHDIPGESGGGSAITLGSNFIDNWAINGVVDNIGSGAGSNNLTQGIYVSSAYGGVWNCRVSRVAGWGIHLYHSSTNCLVLNNLVYNCGFNSGTTGGGFMVANDGNYPSYPINQGTVVANNIACFNNGYGLREVGDVGSNTYTNNCFWMNVQGPSGIIASGSPVVKSISANPGFTNYQSDNTGDYHLASTSLCISAGIDTSGYGLTYDLDNKTRPQIGGYDIGPYEYGSSVFVMMPIV